MRRALICASVAALMLTGTAVAEDVQTTVRVFQLRHSTVLEASLAVQPLLSQYGSLTVQPRAARITVQDRPEVVTRVAEVVASLDHERRGYRIRVDLLLGSMARSAGPDEVPVDAGMKEMFRFRHYQRLATATFEGDLGQEVAAELGDGFRLSFLPSALAQDMPWGIPDSQGRVHLVGLALVRLDRRPGGTVVPTEVLRTNIILSPGQRAIVGASASESSATGLVLVLHALRTGLEPVEEAR